MREDERTILIRRAGSGFAKQTGMGTVERIAGLDIIITIPETGPPVVLKNSYDDPIDVEGFNE